MTDSKRALAARPFEMKDLVCFNSAEDFDVWKIMEFNLSKTDTDFVTLVNAHGITVAILGLKFSWPGVAEVCILRSKSVEKHRMEFASLVKFIVDTQLSEQWNLHRAEMYVDASWPQARRWAQFLGFREVGLAEKLHNGQDHLYFERVFDGR